MTQAVMFRSAYKQLTPTQRVFVDNVVHHLEQAAHRANERITLALSRPIPQEIVDRSHGMLEQALVQAAIETRVRDIAAEQELSPARWVKEVMCVAFSNIQDAMSIEADGTPAWDFSRLTPDQWRSIKKIKFKGGNIDELMQGGRRPPEIEIEMHSKLDALKMLGGYMSLMESDNPHWRADAAQVARTALPADATPQDAAAEYQRMLEG